MKPIKVAHVNSNQGALSQQLMDAVRELCLDPKFSHMTVSTLIGVLEMMKHEMMERNT